MIKYIKVFIVFIYNFHKSFIFKRKTKSLYSQLKINGTLDPSLPSKLSRDDIFRPLGLRNCLKSIRIYSSISGVASNYYIPEHIYYTHIEPTLNNKAYSKAYSDKNFYDLLWDDLTPYTYFRAIDGVLYDNSRENITFKDAQELIESSKKFVIKIATDSGGGKGVSLFEKNGIAYVNLGTNKICLFEEILRQFGRDFVCQRWIKNHYLYQLYNPTSLNTIRILTYRSIKTENIYILHTILRVGSKGSLVDNQASGGYACGVNEDGELRGIAVNKNGSIFTKTNNVPLEKGLKLYAIDEIKNVAIKIAEKFPYARLLGLDFCVDEEGRIKLIEVNSVNNEINFYQMCNGPLFSSFTKEIISYAGSNKKSYCFDFYA